MSLDQLANIAEVVGNLVVVVTLIYVAVQVRQGSATLRSESRQSQVNTDQNGVYLFVEHPELANYFSQDETPTFEQKTKLIFWIIAQMRAREHEWLQYKSGALDEETWMSYRDVIYFLLGTKRSRALWGVCSQYFNSEFVVMVDGMMTNAPADAEFWSRIDSVEQALHNMKLKWTKEPVTSFACAIAAPEPLRSLTWCQAPVASWEDAVGIAMRFPGVEEAVSYGEPSLKVRKSLLTRLRKNDNSIVLLDVDMFERDQLIQSEPNVYFLEEHYAGHDIVLARLAALELVPLEMFLERRWRNIAPKKLVKEHDNG